MKKLRNLFMVFLMVLIVLGGCQQNKKLQYKDGVFKAESDRDENGWKSIINIMVEDGQITEVDYDEENSKGEKKSADKDYSKSMEDASGISPSDAYEQLEKALINTQDPQKIDAVTGATGSSGNFKELAGKALETRK